MRKMKRTKATENENNSWLIGEDNELMVHF